MFYWNEFLECLYENDSELIKDPFYHMFLQSVQTRGWTHFP